MNVETLAQGKNASAFDTYSDLTEEQTQQFNERIDDIYLSFLQKVKLKKATKRSLKISSRVDPFESTARLG